MQVEAHFLNIDELFLGFDMYYGADENGEFHCVAFGILIFQLAFYTYEKQ